MRDDELLRRPDTILLVYTELSQSIWPWLRLSVIGALHYETSVADAAATSPAT